MYRINFYDRIDKEPLWIEADEEKFNGKNIDKILEGIMNQNNFIGTYDNKAIGINLKNIVYIKIERI